MRLSDKMPIEMNSEVPLNGFSVCIVDIRDLWRSRWMFCEEFWSASWTSGRHYTIMHFCAIKFHQHYYIIFFGVHTNYLCYLGKTWTQRVLRSSKKSASCLLFACTFCVISWQLRCYPTSTLLRDIYARRSESAKVFGSSIFLHNPLIRG
jgi:hypothetical protein